MITIDGKWIMEGLSRSASRRIKTSQELVDYVNEVGFLPLFKNSVKGFSVEEMTASDSWWAGVPGEDPWEWREVITAEGNLAYGKLFGNRAGYISKEWYPYFASYRRDGYDFDSRYEDGLASHRTKRIMDVLSIYDMLPSNELRVMAGFGVGGEKGYEGALTSLQMQTYITIRCFKKRTNKKNVEYGWPVAYYSISEKLFGEDYVRSAYKYGTDECKARIMDHLAKRYPDATRKEIEKVIK